MSNLQDQLLKAGLVSEKDAKKMKKEKAKKAKVQRKSSEPVVNETREQAKQALTEKAERDRQLNAEINAESERKALAAQIRQLITLNAQKRQGDVAYNFTHGNKIKKIYVSPTMQKELSNGLLAIASLGEGYEVIPRVVAEKITQRDDQAVVSICSRSESGAANEDEDPYADYQIPDDLMW